MVDNKAKNIIVVDMDGTISDATHRLHHIHGPGKKNWKRFFAEMEQDPPIASVLEQVRQLQREHPIVILTGRPEEYRAASERWLAKYGVKYDELLMRRTGDRRPDFQAKEQLLRELGPERVLMAIDDREPVCEAYRKHGVNAVLVGSNEENQEVNEVYRKISR
jgi:uncharacterized HAD superfamily protein